jgi:Pectate lyase superfamily protein
MPNKSIPAMGDPNWGIPLNAHLSQLQNPTNGGINTWLNTAARPTLTVDDQGKTGVNLDTGYIEQWTGTSWMNLTKMGLFTVNSVFSDLVNINPANTTRVYTAGYWTKDDFGGGVFEWDAASTKDVDGGRYFASKYPGITSGRWVRKMQDNVNVLHYGALPDRNFPIGANNEYGYGGYYDDIVPTSNLLSTKFSNLNEAQNWYWFNSLNSITNEINNAAIQSAIEHNIEIYVPEGIYRLNVPLKIIRKRNLFGSGRASTILKFIDCAGMIPRVSLTNGDVNFVFGEFISISNFTLIGTGSTTSNFDVNKCGIGFPVNENNGYRGTPFDYSDKAPNTYICKIQNMNISGFAGHGVMFLEGSSFLVDNIYSSNNAGHSIFLNGGNTTVLRSCWVGACGQGRSGYRIWNGALIDTCNGIDAPNSWGTFGSTTADGGINSPCRIKIINSNIEMSPKPIVILYGGFVDFDNCSFQSDIQPSNPYHIFDEGYSTWITITNSIIYTQNATTVKAFIKVDRSNFTGNYKAIGLFNLGLSAADTSTNTPAHNYKEVFLTVSVNNAGNEEILTIPSLDGRLLRIGGDGNPVLSSPNFHSRKLYIGDNSTYKNQTGTLVTSTGTPLITSGDGSPEGVISGIKGSFYMRTDGGAGTTMYVKESGTGNTGWVAK